MSLLVELFPAEDLDMLEGLVDARLLAIARWAEQRRTLLKRLRPQLFWALNNCGFSTSIAHEWHELLGDVDALLSQVRAPAPTHTKDGEQ